MDILKRPRLLTGILILLALVLYLPTRVLFVEVEGNRAVPDRQILEAAEDCGIAFGASRRDIRSEKVKNALLSRIPQLQWAGINTSGCRAVISVKEQEDPAQVPDNSIQRIVAACDGVITSCTATSGTALCSPGQAVKEGQLLISPYTDCGISIRVASAEGEVYAQTARKTRAVMPKIRTELRQTGKTGKRYSLILGKKRINFWKGSGISDTSCGRMYEEYYMTLPGGFRLPVRIGAETVSYRSSSPEESLPAAAEELLGAYAVHYTLARTVAGNVLSQARILSEEDSLWVLDATFVCTEMIGRVTAEKIGEVNEQNS